MPDDRERLTWMIGLLAHWFDLLLTERGLPGPLTPDAGGVSPLARWRSSLEQEEPGDADYFYDLVTALFDYVEAYGLTRADLARLHLRA